MRILVFKYSECGQGKLKICREKNERRQEILKMKFYGHSFIFLTTKQNHLNFKYVFFSGILIEQIKYQSVSI